MAAFEEFDAHPVRFALEGRLDSAGVEQIETKLTASVRAGTRNVILDLADVPFVGSLGIRMLISIGRVLASLLKKPAQIPALVHTARTSNKAFEQLLRCRDLCGVGFSGADL